MAPKKRNVAAAAMASKKKVISFNESTVKEASSAVDTVRAGNSVRKGVSLAAPAGGRKKKGSGIVEAAAGTRKRRREKDREMDEDMDTKEHHHASTALIEEEDDANSLADSSSNDGDVEAGDDMDNLSDLDDAESADDESDNDNPFVRAHKTGTRLSYPALRLSYLPVEFQEPQLFKFLDQFGAKVLNCFCVRSRRTHQSKGIAYVQFDRESVLPLAIEECHGMSLGGRSIQARKVILHRSMPTKEKVARRRKLAYAYATKGAPLKHHNVTHKSPVALVIGAAKTETQNNEHLKRLGIDFATHFFTSQIEGVPKNLLTKKVRGVAQAQPSAEAVAAANGLSRPAKVAKKEAASQSSGPATPVKSTASPRSSASPIKTRTPSPKKKVTPKCSPGGKK